MAIWIITVNFGHTEATKSLIDSLSLVNNLHSIRIGIADNAASIKSKFELNEISKKSNLNITIFSNEKNLFYWSAAKKVINNEKRRRVIATKNFARWRYCIFPLV